MKHEVIRVDNLMYKGCEPHWKCVKCGKCVPFHCYSKRDFEMQKCKAEVDKAEQALSKLNGKWGE